MLHLFAGSMHLDSCFLLLGWKVESVDVAYRPWGDLLLRKILDYYLLVLPRVSTIMFTLALLALPSL